MAAFLDMEEVCCGGHLDHFPSLFSTPFWKVFPLSEFISTEQLTAWHNSDILSFAITNYITPQQLIAHQSNPLRHYLSKQLFTAQQLVELKSVLLILFLLLVKLQTTLLCSLCYKLSKIHCCRTWQPAAKPSFK